MRYRLKTIGSRLIAAFTCVLCIVGLVSAGAFLTWQALDRQVARMLDNSIPALKASYQMERNSAELQAYLHEIHTTPNLSQLKQIHAGLHKEMNQLNLTIATIVGLPQVNELQQEYQRLAGDIQAYTDTLKQKIILNQALNKQTEMLLWLHQDLVDELTPLNKELEWQIINASKSQLSDEKHDLISQDFSTLQQLTFNENALVSLIQEIIRQPKQRDLNSTFQFIGYKTEELRQLSDDLQHNAASIAQHQIMLEIIAIVQPEGKLHQLLREMNTITLQADTHQQAIKFRLAAQQQQIKQLVAHTSRDLASIKQEAKRTVSAGNLWLLIMLTCALVSSIFICTYFVRKRIVARLSDLSRDLNAVVTGDVALSVSVSGQDEIGKLGDDLRHFCKQRREMEKTNALNLINNTQASLITCTTQGIIESMNHRATELFPQLSTDGTTSESIWELFPAQQRVQLKSIFTQNSPLLRSSADKLTLPITNEQAQTRYFRLDLRLFRQNSVPKVIITLTDITEQENIARWLERKVQEKTRSLSAANLALQEEIEERKRTEAVLVTTQDDLIQAAKMAVVGQAMTTLAHEMNQPLSALSTYIFTVKMRYPADAYAELNQTMDKMNEICERMDHIIANLRSFSKKTTASHPVGPINLCQATQHAIDIVACKAQQHNIQLQSHLAPDCTALGEAVQVEQILVNLLMNSCDALAPLVNTQGKVEVLELSRTEHTLTLACCDNGQGFDHTIISQLFTPFTTTKEVGLGLGLSICRSIMNRINGSIYLASTLSGGAMIILEFSTHDAQ
ncbi:ATP-binding protein [Photobacterium sp. MCCC 1A19761]|uniref:ATP-binding protein n=1 Tax=Photobacterium sp. MCCC 1A19761 TaxID=3115000 RepID=UPI00307FC562